MKILDLDKTEGFAKIRVENEDDLWFLKDWITPRDKVKKLTQRTKLDGREKKTCKITLEVEKISYENDRLRLTGEITEGVEDIELGYHTFNITNEEETFDIWKNKPPKDTWERLSERENQRHYEVLFALIDKGEADFYVVRESGIEDLSGIHENIPGKMYETDTEGSDFHQRVIEIIERVSQDMDNIILCGPGHEKNKLKEKLSEQLQNKTFLQDTSVTGHTGLNEAIKRGALKKVVESSRIEQETSIVEEFFQELEKDGKAVFGEPVKEMAQQGAIETLIITTERKRENPELLNKVNQMGGEVKIVNTDHEAGERLENLSGLAALLRYKP